MYELFTGTLPFEADTSMGVLTKHIYMTPTAPSLVLGNGPMDLVMERIILKCLEKQPDKRFRDLEDLLHHLESAGASQVGTDSTRLGERDSEAGLLTRVSEPPRILEIGWVSWLAAAAGLAALVLAGALLLGPSGESSKKAPRVRALSTQPTATSAAQGHAAPGKGQPAPPRPKTATRLAPPPAVPKQEQVTLRPAPEDRAVKRAAQPPAAASGAASQDATLEQRAPDSRPVPPRAAPPKEVIDPWAE
jgi:serine/threonine-protein kinase